jgi:hypothetical protein
VPYERGRGRGFLTKKPSRRAKALAKKAGVKVNPKIQDTRTFVSAAPSIRAMLGPSVAEPGRKVYQFKPGARAQAQEFVRRARRMSNVAYVEMVENRGAGGELVPVVLVDFYRQDRTMKAFLTQQACKLCGWDTLPDPVLGNPPWRRNTDRGLRELERRWRDSGAPSDGVPFLSELLRTGGGKAEVEARRDYRLARLLYDMQPTTKHYLLLADALDEHGPDPSWGRFPHPGLYEGNSAVEVAWYEFFQGRAVESYYGHGSWGELYGLEGDVQELLETVGPEGHPLPDPHHPPGLESGLPVDWFRILRSHQAALVTGNDWGTRINLIEEWDDALEQFRQLEAEGLEVGEEGWEENPDPRKRRAARRATAGPGDLQAQARHLMERVRAGEVPMAHVVLAYPFGSNVARLVMPQEAVGTFPWLQADRRDLVRWILLLNGGVRMRPRGRLSEDMERDQVERIVAWVRGGKAPPTTSLSERASLPAIATSVARARSGNRIHLLVRRAVEVYANGVYDHVQSDVVGQETSPAWSWTDTDGLPVIRKGPRGGLTLSRLRRAAERRASQLLVKTLLRE